MAEIVYDQVPKLGWSQSFNLVNKGHPIAKRVFETYKDICDYVLDPNSSAVSGIITVALQDWTDTTDNKVYKSGAYLVKQVPGDLGYTTALITRLATGETQQLTVGDDSKQYLSISEDKIDVNVEALRSELMSWIGHSFD